MTSPLSVDLRGRVVSAVMAGASCRQAGGRFGVSAASVSRWHTGHLRDGHVRPKPMGGDQRSQVIEVHAPRILRLCQERGNIALSERRDALAEQGVTTSTSSLSRLLARHRITRKKGLCTPPSSTGRTCRGAPGLVREPDRPRSGPSGVHCRDRRFDPDGASR